MKKFFIAIMALTMTLGVYAQDSIGNARPERRESNRPGRQRREFTPEEVAAKQAMDLKEKIEGISNQQYEQIYAIYLWRAQESKHERDSIMANRKEGERPQMNREKMQQRENVVVDALKLILDEKQYAAYEKLQNEQRQRMRQRMRQRQMERREGERMEGLREPGRMSDDNMF